MRPPEGLLRPLWPLWLCTVTPWLKVRASVAEWAEFTNHPPQKVCDVNSGGKLQVGDLPELQLSFLSFLSHGYHYKTVHIRDYSQPWTVLCI